MKKLIIATNNQGKVREIKKILEGYYDEICSLKDEGISADVVEDGATFLENAEKKAVEISRLRPGCQVLADDSGLCVKGLGWGPGVYSARYSEAGTESANNEKLKQEVAPLAEADRQAKYVCAIVMAKDGHAFFSCEGECWGRIITEEQGSEGFGYDPLFFVEEYGKTFGCIPPEEKNKISHRAKALQAVKEYVSR